MTGENAEERASPQTVVGRTTSDAVVEITHEAFRLLGRAAPAVVFLAVLGFGVYKFMELQNEKLADVQQARDDARAENLATISTLKDTILQDATTLMQLQRSNLEVLQGQLQQHEAIQNAITVNQQRFLDLEREKAQGVAALSEQAAEHEKLRRELDAAKQEVAASAAEEAALVKRIEALEMTTRVADHLVAVLNSPAPLVPSLEPAQIAERYEGQSADHVGLDHAGHSYYGTFRIRGAVEMKPFLGFLHKHAPGFAEVLERAGGAEAAAAGSAAFQQSWRRLARDPEFEAIQRRFIHEGDYRAAVMKCKHGGGWDVSSMSVAVQSVVWSMAVQHGSARAGQLCLEAAGQLQGSGGDGAAVAALYRLRREGKREFFPDQDDVIYRLLDIRYALEEGDARKILERFPSRVAGGG